MSIEIWSIGGPNHPPKPSNLARNGQISSVFHRFPLFSLRFVAENRFPGHSSMKRTWRMGAPDPQHQPLRPGCALQRLGVVPLSPGGVRVRHEDEAPAIGLRPQGLFQGPEGPPKATASLETDRYGLETAQKTGAEKGAKAAERQILEPQGPSSA